MVWARFWRGPESVEWKGWAHGHNDKMTKQSQQPGSPSSAGLSTRTAPAGRPCQAWLVVPVLIPQRKPNLRERPGVQPQLQTSGRDPVAILVVPRSKGDSRFALSQALAFRLAVPLGTVNPAAFPPEA